MRLCQISSVLAGALVPWVARRELVATMKRHKYRAKPCIVGGQRFDSQREAARYLDLKLLEKSGHICHLKLQPEFDLTVLGQLIGRYRADFEYVLTENGEVIVEDAKGMKLPMYRWKVKHLKAEHGVEVREV